MNNSTAIFEIYISSLEKIFNFTKEKITNAHLLEE